MTAQETFEAMVKDGIWPFLKRSGFRRTKGTFHRAVGENWQVINLQKSAYSDRGHIRFTVNLGVGLDRLRGGVHTWSEGRRPTESRCQLRERLGFLLRGQDTWWEVRPETDTAALADTMTLALERYAFPWLDARSTDEAVVMLLSDPAHIRTEYIYHLHWFEKLLAQLGREDLRAAVEQERRRKDAELKHRRQLDGRG